jgi:hypothetical protein
VFVAGPVAKQPGDTETEADAHISLLPKPRVTELHAAPRVVLGTPMKIPA